jgi:hypothetical protein
MIDDIFIKKPWKEKEEIIDNKDDFLNGLPFEEVSDMQQMLYILYKKIEELDDRIKILEEVKR